MLIDAEALRTLIRATFERVGCAPDEGQRIAHYLVESNLTGHDSHGVIRVPRYVHWVREGHVVPNQHIDVVTDGDGIAVIDGQFGFGQSIGVEAVAWGIERAKARGSAVVALRNTGHLGRIGDWAEMAAAAGMISVHFVNTTGLGLLVAPFGGSERRMSTNPVAIGVPRAGSAPVVLDCATSIVAEGKVLVALNGGKELPEGALITGDGQPSTDPAMIYGDVSSSQPLDMRSGEGAIRAMGEHKGSGLAIMCELLAGALTGGGCGRADEDRLVNNMLSIYMAEERFELGEGYAAELSRYVDFVHSARPVEPGGTVMLPGEPEEKMRAERGQNGIPLTTPTWQSLMTTAKDVGVAESVLAGMPSEQ